jgi:hypothetical protein
MSYHDQMVALAEEGSKLVKDHKITATKYGDFAEQYSNYFADYQKCYNGADYELQQSVAQTIRNAKIFTGVLYVVGAATLAYSAYSVGKKIYDYYNPKYDAVPDALVDLVRTVDGDRYIKYDVVLEANAKKDGGYAAGDLNAYEGQRWNALYYTKSYEAGKPLLAKFALSNTNNRAGKDYLAVHRFGEEVCYDLNKYNFSNKSDNIFLSVAQSENQKSAVTDVPDIVGSIFGAGMWLIAGAAGALVGVGGTLGVQALSKKKKASEANQ